MQERESEKLSTEFSSPSHEPPFITSQKVRGALLVKLAIITESLLAMITAVTLYNLANGLGATAIVLIVCYHFLAVNAKHLSSGVQSS